MDNYCFGKFKKAKYELIRNGTVIYFFVTTIHDEYECIALMTERVELKMEVEKDMGTYRFVKIQDGKRRELKRMRLNEIAA